MVKARFSGSWQYGHGDAGSLIPSKIASARGLHGLPPKTWIRRPPLWAEERGDGADAIIAKHIIELAQAGERDADRLCDYALAKLREADGRSSQFQSSLEARAAALKPGPQI